YFWRALIRIPWSIAVVLKPGGNIEPLYNDSVADLSTALRLNPGRGETWLARANIHFAWANYQTMRGKDASAVLRLTVSDLDVATQKLPESVEAPERRAQIELLLASQPGEDGKKRCQAAVDCFETVLARNAKSPTGLAGRGEARMR